MTVSINIENVLTYLEKAVEKRGKDYVDERAAEDAGCVYVVRDIVKVEDPEEGEKEVLRETPGCIVGTALFLAGIPLKQIGQMDRAGDFYSAAQARVFLDDSERTESDVEDYLPEDLEISVDAAEVLIVAQREQDSGETWGWALSEATETRNKLLSEN